MPENDTTLLDWTAPPDYVVHARWLLEGILLPTIGVVGIIGNLVSLLVIFKTELDLNGSFIRLIAILCMFDCLCLVFNILIFSGPLLNEYYRHQIFPHLVPVILPLAQISLTGSIYTILAVAIERFISVARPHYQFSRNLSLIVSVIILIFSVLVNFNRLFEYKTETVFAGFDSSLDIEGAVKISENLETEVTEWKWNIVKPTQLRLYKQYAEISTVVSILINLIPFGLLVVLNFFIYRTIRKKTFLLPQSSHRERRDIFVATILILIVMVYAICHSIKAFINLLELFSVLTGRDHTQLWGPKMNIIVAVSHVLITLNCSGNFAIYCSKDKKFRSFFIQFLTCGCILAENQEQMRNYPTLCSFNCISFKLSGHFKMKYSSVRRKLSRDNHVDICLTRSKEEGQEFIETYQKDTLHVERQFSFTNYFSLISDEQMEVTAV